MRFSSARISYFSPIREHLEKMYRSSITLYLYKVYCDQINYFNRLTLLLCMRLLQHERNQRTHLKNVQITSLPGAYLELFGNRMWISLKKTKAVPYSYPAVTRHPTSKYRRSNVLIGNDFSFLYHKIKVSCNRVRSAPLQLSAFWRYMRLGTDRLEDRLQVKYTVDVVTCCSQQHMQSNPSAIK